MMTTRTIWLGLAALGGVAVVAAVALGRSRGMHVATIPAGTTLVAAFDEEVSTAHVRAGDVVRLRTVAPIRLGEKDEIPTGVVVQATVTESKGGGRVAGAPVLALRFADLVVDGARHSIDAEPYRAKGRNDLGKSAAQIGAGAVAGANVVLPAGQTVRIHMDGPVTVAYHPHVDRPDAS